MKKLVPDPPPIPSTSPVFSRDKAIRTAAEYFDMAIDALDRLPDHVVLEKQPDVGHALLNLKIGRAFLLVAMERPPLSTST